MYLHKGQKNKEKIISNPLTLTYTGTLVRFGSSVNVNVMT